MTSTHRQCAGRCFTLATKGWCFQRLCRLFVIEVFPSAANLLVTSLMEPGCWRRRESNPRPASESTSTDSDTSRTEVVQNRYKEPSSTELPAKATAKGATLPEHIPHTSDTSLCVTSVPDESRVKDTLPTDIPSTVLARLRNWHKLPEPIRRAVEALLAVVEE